ncbi:3'-5' exonuclease [Streptomyces atratus]|uniref:3'-5' exonuclease n=1 Tax=Streptomyces atratus TaxID=1893 RepID=UPI00365227C3
MDGEGRTVVNELLDPRRSITAEASALHGITRADVVNAPSFSDVLPQLTGALEGRRCVAYNCGFYPRTPGTSQASHGETRRRPAVHAGMRAA